MDNDTEVISLEADDIKRRIFMIRGRQVMLDKDLAELYGYEVKNLNRQVKRNIRRFPKDFMFQLTQNEMDIFGAKMSPQVLRAELFLMRSLSREFIC